MNKGNLLSLRTAGAFLVSTTISAARAACSAQLQRPNGTFDWLRPSGFANLRLRRAFWPFCSSCLAILGRPVRGPQIFRKAPFIPMGSLVKALLFVCLATGARCTALPSSFFDPNFGARKVACLATIALNGTGSEIVLERMSKNKP